MTLMEIRNEIRNPNAQISCAIYCLSLSVARMHGN